LRTVRFGSTMGLSDAGVFLGRERGYFREQGLDVDFVPFQSGPDTMVPMAAGDLEVGSGNFGIVWLNAVERGVGIQAVADKGHSSPGFEFVQVPLRRDLADSGQVQTPADLRGRRIGMSVLRSGGEVVVADILRRGGMGVDDVDLVALGYPEMLAGLTNRALDAAVLIEPTLSAAVARGIVAPWEAGRASTVFGGAYQASLIFYAGQFAAQSDLAQRWMVAYLRGIRAYNDAFIRGEGRAEAVRLLTETTAIKDPAVYDQMQMAGLDPDGRINQESLRIELEYYRNRGYYTGPVTLDRVIDPSFAETAARQLGPYR
jgi:NitT/TauT family transport system substrate-binding protein